MAEFLINKYRYDSQGMLVGKGRIEQVKIDNIPYVVAEKQNNTAVVSYLNMTELNPGRTNLVLFHAVACWAKKFGYPEITGEMDLLDVPEDWILSRGFSIWGYNFRAKTDEYLANSEAQLSQWKIRITEHTN